MSLSRQYLPTIATEEHDLDVALAGVEETARALQDEEAEGQRYLQALDGISSQPVVATEGFKENMQRAWETIKAWIVRLLRLWNEHINQVRHIVTLLEVRSEAARERLREAAGRRSLTGTFQYQGDLSRLSTMYHPPKNVTQVMNALRSLTTHVDAYYTWSHKKLRPQAEAVAGVLQRASLPWSERDVSQIQGALQGADPRQLTQAVFFTEMGQGMMSAPLLNNQRLYLAPSTGEGVSRYTGTTLRLRHSMTPHRPMGQLMSFPHFPLQTGEQLLNQVDELLSTLKKQHTSGTNRARAATLSKLRKVLERVTQTSQSLPDQSPQAKEDAYQAIRVVRTVIDWMSNPYEGLTTSSLNSVRATLRLVHQNVA